jgi:hypothetical protein
MDRDSFRTIPKGRRNAALLLGTLESAEIIAVTGEDGNRYDLFATVTGMTSGLAAQERTLSNAGAACYI